jgi:hypothetical protein
VNIKEGIPMNRTAYSVLKEEMKEDRCGWSNRSYVRRMNLCVNLFVIF